MYWIMNTDTPCVARARAHTHTHTHTSPPPVGQLGGGHLDRQTLWCVKRDLIQSQTRPNIVSKETYTWTTRRRPSWSPDTMMGSTGWPAVLENVFSILENVFSLLENVFSLLENVFLSERVFSILENVLSILENVFSLLENVFSFVHHDRHYDAFCRLTSRAGIVREYVLCDRECVL